MAKTPPFYKVGLSNSAFKLHEPGHDGPVVNSSGGKSSLTFNEVQHASSGTTDFPTLESRKTTSNRRETAEIASYLPGLNIPSQLFLAGDDAISGNYKEAATNLAFALPFAKPIAKGAKLLSKAGKYLLGGKKAKSVSNITKATPDKPYTPKELPNYNVDITDRAGVENVLNITKHKGKMLDKSLPSDFQYKASMFRKMPTISGRKMIDFNPEIKGLPSQRLYKSTGLAGKVNKAGKSSKGMWVPLEGFGTNRSTKGWFIKGQGWDEGYGSKTFKNIGKQIKAFGYD